MPRPWKHYKLITAVIPATSIVILFRWVVTMTLTVVLWDGSSILDVQWYHGAPVPIITPVLPRCIGLTWRVRTPILQQTWIRTGSVTLNLSFFYEGTESSFYSNPLANGQSCRSLGWVHSYSCYLVPTASVLLIKIGPLHTRVNRRAIPHTVVKKKQL